MASYVSFNGNDIEITDGISLEQVLETMAMVEPSFSTAKLVGDEPMKRENGDLVYIYANRVGEKG